MLRSPEPNKIGLTFSVYVHVAAVELFTAKATRQVLFKCSKNLYLKTEYQHEKLFENLFKSTPILASQNFSICTAYFLDHRLCA